MSQETTRNVLKENGGWMTCKEIAGKLEVSVSTVSTNLKKLKKGKFIEMKRFRRPNRTTLPKYKIVEDKENGKKGRNVSVVKGNKKA